MDKDFHKALATWQEALENLAEAKRLSTEAVRLSAKAKSLGFPGEYSVSSRTNSGSKCFEKQVPWTEKNEAFFKWVADNMARLIDGLISIESPEKMVEAINAGRLLPLGNSDKGA